MKRNFLFLVAGVLILYSCQTAPKNEVFDSGPEVDDAKKYFDAWVAGDWDGLRALYADTALSVHNSTEFTADSVISFHKKRRLNYDKVAYKSDALEFVKYEDGSGWTHAWGSITLTIKGTGKEVEVPIHAARQIAGGKIGREYLFYNTLPIAMALEEASAAAATPSK